MTHLSSVQSQYQINNRSNKSFFIIWYVARTLSQWVQIRMKALKGDVSNIYRFFFVIYILSKFILKRWKPTLDLLALEYEYMTQFLQVQNITGLCLFKWIKKCQHADYFIYKLDRSVAFYMRVGQTVRSNSANSPKCFSNFISNWINIKIPFYTKISFIFFCSLNFMNHIT